MTKRTPIPFALRVALVLLGISAFINYVDRGNLSIAAPMLRGEFGISASQLGLLLSALFWTYACLQPVAGWLVDRFNVNWVLAAGFLLWSGATAMTGLTHTFAALFVVRLLVGAGESVAFPSYSKIVATNFGEEHRGAANAAISAGLVLGPGFGMILGATVMARFGWRPFFIGLGLVCLLWLVPWLRWAPKKRIVHSRVVPPPKLSEILRVRSLWGASLGLFSANYVNYFIITWLPYYLVRERGFSLTRMSRIGGFAYLCGALVTLLSGWLSDRWLSSGASPTLVRKTFPGVGVALAGIFVGIAGATGSIAALVVGVCFIGFCSSNMWAIAQRLAGPRAAGRWVGIQNLLGNLAGVAAPAITGFVLERTGHFGWAFATVAVVALVGSASIFLVVGPIEQVEWSSERAAAVAAHG